jgi:hypothetical protein
LSFVLDQTFGLFLIMFYISFLELLFLLAPY